MNKTIGQFAADLRLQDIEVTGPELFTWLRENGYLISEPGVEFNAPTDKGSHYFEVKTKCNQDDSEVTTIKHTTLINDEGQNVVGDIFIDEYLEFQDKDAFENENKPRISDRHFELLKTLDEALNLLKEEKLLRNSLLEQFGVEFDEKDEPTYESMIKILDKLGVDLISPKPLGKYVKQLLEIRQKNSL